MLRLSYVPLIICAIKGSFFVNDLWSIFLVSGLGYTNGYLGSIAIIMVSEWVDEKDKGLAGTFVSNLYVVCLVTSIDHCFSDWIYIKCWLGCWSNCVNIS